MKVLFLDHFGVMCLADKHGIENNHNTMPRISEMRVHGDFDKFDFGAVEILNSIIKNDIEIVISSDWKTWCNINKMREFYISQGIKKMPLDFTPNIQTNGAIQKRELEIQKWLETNPKITHWVAIDDLYLGKSLTNFVWVSKTDEGIKQEGLKEKIMHYLNI